MKFQELLDKSDYLKSVLRIREFNVYEITTYDIFEIIKLLETNGVNYEIKSLL
jgi:hypothetical protein